MKKLLSMFVCTLLFASATAFAGDSCQFLYKGGDFSPDGCDLTASSYAKGTNYVSFSCQVLATPEGSNISLHGQPIHVSYTYLDSNSTNTMDVTSTNPIPSQSKCFKLPNNVDSSSGSFRIVGVNASGIDEGVSLFCHAMFGLATSSSIDSCE
jgi:hypothetical protein